MAGKRKKIILIIPSTVIARGLESILEDSGEFSVAIKLNNMARGGDAQLKNFDADALIVDPSIFAYGEIEQGRQVLADCCGTPVIAIQTVLFDEDALKSYDGVINIGDQPVEIIHKLREAIHSESESQKTEDNQLSSREKEILVCVAKGMQNKEIADCFNISTYTVISHRKNISRKTGIRSVAGLTIYALLNNLLDINSIE